MIGRTRLKAVWEHVRPHLTFLTFGAGVAAAAAALTNWSWFKELDSRAFMFGYLTAAATLFVAIRDFFKPAPPDAAEEARTVERRQAAKDWHHAELDLALVQAQRERLQCQKLERELAEGCPT